MTVPPVPQPEASDLELPPAAPIPDVVNDSGDTDRAGAIAVRGWQLGEPRASATDVTTNNLSLWVHRALTFTARHL